MQKLFEKLAGSREDLEPIYSGTMDVVVCEWSDGSLRSTPFHLRIGNLKKMNALISRYLEFFRIDGVLFTQQVPFSRILLQVNGKNCEKYMLLNLQTGIAYFEVNTNENDDKAILTLSKVPTKEILKSLDLKKGLNKLQYFFQAKDTMELLQARIFVINSDCRLIISDIDGTITKSDVMGHLMSMMGKNYTHEDICELYSTLAERGYLILYLSSRSIQQYFYTKSYLDRQQQGAYKLPEGPIMLSDQPLYDAFKTEVIYKTTDVLKSSILKTVKSILESGESIYAGIGNRENDVIAYRYVDIPFQRIFLINKQSQIRQMDGTSTLTYKAIRNGIDEYFPIV